jgi:small subunit ribosomal protein S6
MELPKLNSFLIPKILDGVIRIMRTYEIVVVYNGNISDTALKAEAKKIKDLLTTQGAQNVQLENWGKRELSYTMGTSKHGYYINYMFSSDNHAVVAEAQRILSISDDVARYQTLRTDIKSKKFKATGRKPVDFNVDTDDFIQSAMMN